MMSQEGKPKIFIQFAGQGMKYMDELRRLHQMSPNIQPFVQKAAAAIQRELSEYNDSETGFFTQGLDVMRWIEYPDETPDAAYMLSSPLSHPLIYLCQIATYISVLEDGLDPDWLLAHTHSATGFSTGIVAAVIVAMGLPLPELREVALKGQAMFFWQGVRCQQSISRFGINPKLETAKLDVGDGSPSCMASINNITRQQLDELCSAFSDYGIAHPAYELMPDRWIVAGLPDNLIVFSHFIREKNRDFAWKFIPSTIAAHCPFLNYALQTSPQDAKRTGLSLSGSQLKIPVWSNDTGANLGDSSDIVWDVMQAYFTRTALWRKQIAPLVEQSGITHVLDFGPGAGVASLTESYLVGTETQVIRCTIPLGRRKLFDEIGPTLN
ncbi:MAG: ACP S-malonyltransferase [Deltaproteobacteria bacterium]|nr:ACP S-malonyltransferase [Deltaproteobacteria bacterium]